ncbi:MAG: TIGR01212 family radical SAM protein [bacterium]|nr:TIGR01212 family radical SAM protein [bacterium]
MFEEWGGKRYNNFNHHLKKVFGEKVYRVSIDARFTCPNRDGTLGRGGCIFCDEGGSRAGYVVPELPVREQIKKGIELIRKNTGARKFIAYFQAFSNTYASPEKLEKIYREALEIPDVVGISISTRPDLVPDDVLDLLEEIGKNTYLWLELGVQTLNEKVLKRLNRKHTVEQTVDAIQRTLRRPHIRILAHLILGLPGENEEEILNTATGVSKLGVHGVKLHHLYVIRGTVLQRLYEKGIVKVYEKPEDYAEIAVKFLEHLSPEIIIHRLQGFARENLVAPSWTANKFAGIQAIERMLEEKNSYQGKFYEN